MALRHLAGMRGIAPVVEAGQLFLELFAVLAEFGERGFDGLELLAPGRRILARFVAAFAVPLVPLALAGLGLGRRVSRAAAFLEPGGVIVEIAVVILDDAVRHEPELVADA